MAECPDRDYLPTAHWDVLKLRAKVLRRLRRFFEERAFVEVETPILSQDTVVDLYIDPIPVELFDDPRAPQANRRMWLQTSPEFGMKRLLAAGADKIFQITKAFRAGERGTLHNPEFTIVEWYRVGDDMQQAIDLLAELADQMLTPQQPTERISYAAAFQHVLGLNPHTATIAELASRAGPDLQPSHSQAMTRDDWLNYLLATHIEPELGRNQPTILFDFPASQAALARTRGISGKQISGNDLSGNDLSATARYEVAERFELYASGIELANGYHELLDPQVLRERNSAGNARRLADGRYTVPEDSRLLSAMEHGMPPCAGVALGFDRLVMIIAGARQLADVMPFPIDRA